MADRLAFAPDVAAEIGRWRAYLGAERRMSPKTLEAYERDVGQFLRFMAEHLGGPPSLTLFGFDAPALYHAHTSDYAAFANGTFYVGEDTRLIAEYDNSGNVLRRYVPGANPPNSGDTIHN